MNSSRTYHRGGRTLAKQSEPLRLLAPLFESGFEQVISLRMARAVWQWHLWPRTILGAVGSTALAAGWPLLLEAVMRVAAPEYSLHTLRAITWVAALAFLDTLAILSAWFAWQLWVKAARSLEDLTAGCEDINSLIQWYARALSKKRQYVVSIIWAIVAVVFLRVVQHTISVKLEIGPVSYISVAWTGAIGANMVYWVIVNPEMIRRLLRLKHLNLVWYSPASTPAIAKLSGGLAFTTTAVVGAALTTEFLAFHLFRYGKSDFLTAATIFVPALAGILALVVGLLPHLRLYEVVRDSRRISLEKLRRLIQGHPPTSAVAARRGQGIIELYRLVEQSPGLPFSTAAIVQYAAAVLGSLVAYLLTR